VQVSATAVRVPVQGGHSESVTGHVPQRSPVA